MPYQWFQADRTTASLHLWPYRSLPKRGFVWFIAVTAALFALPVLAYLGTAVLWVLLAFALCALAAIWAALQRSYQDGEILEVLSLSDDLITLIRHGPRGKRQDWQARPHWVRLTLYPDQGPVPNYLTLRGNQREVELGRFLSEDERKALHQELIARLAR